MYDFTTLRCRRNMGAEKWSPLDAQNLNQADLVPFSIADMELLVAPEITSALKQAADFGVYGYTMAEAGYRQAVCQWMARRHGWEIEEDWMFQSFGVVPAMNLAIHALTQPGEGVIVQPPVYPPFYRVVNATGRQVCENPLLLRNGRYEMDFEGLEALARRPDVKLLLLCSPHNPVGRVWTQGELRQVAQLCSCNGVTVFSDEIHFDFVHTPYRHTVFATLDAAAAQSCIVATSASKSFNLAGLATANIIVPNPALREALAAKATGYTGEFNNYFGLAATRAAYTHCEGWLEALLAHIRGNYTYCKDFLADRFPSVIVYPLEGTYLLWADFRALGLAPDALERFMVAHQLWLDEGYLFGPGGAGFERLNLACPRRCLEQALARLDTAATQAGLPR